MKRTAITIARPQSIHVRLTDVQDAGHVGVNAYHFDLRVGAPESLLPAMREGANTLSFGVTTRPFRERVLDLALDRPHWHGRFELLVDGRLVSVFEARGVGLLGGASHTVARMELTLFTPVREPRPDELVALLRRVPGMTDSAPAALGQATRRLRFRNAVAVHTWKNRFGVDFVYVCDPAGECVFAGYVGWAHAAGLRRALEQLDEEFAGALA